MIQTRKCWDIGPIQFCANNEDEKGWLVYGMIGTAEVMGETYFIGTLEEVVASTKDWARSYGDQILAAVSTFQWRP